MLSDEEMRSIQIEQFTKLGREAGVEMRLSCSDALRVELERPRYGNILRDQEACSAAFIEAFTPMRAAAEGAARSKRYTFKQVIPDTNYNRKVAEEGGARTIWYDVYDGAERIAQFRPGYAKAEFSLRDRVGEHVREPESSAYRNGKTISANTKASFLSTIVLWRHCIPSADDIAARDKAKAAEREAKIKADLNEEALYAKQKRAADLYDLLAPMAVDGRAAVKLIAEIDADIAARQAHVRAEWEDGARR